MFPDSTVSRVISKAPSKISISKKTRKKVLEIVEELDYHPNLLARSLARKKSDTLGLIIPDITDPFFAQIVKGVGNAVMEEGYSVIICDTDEKVKNEIVHLNILKHRWVDGVMFSGSRDEGDSTHISEIAKKVPVVGIDREIDGDFSCCVSVDNRKGGYEATEYLLKLGHRRIGIMSCKKACHT